MMSYVQWVSRRGRRDGVGDVDQVPDPRIRKRHPSGVERDLSDGHKNRKGPYGGVWS